MNSLLDQLFLIISRGGNSVSYVVAAELFKSYQQNKILTIKELSQYCFVSESSITKFSKKLGYSGYRELIVKLKIELSDRVPINETYSPLKLDLFDSTEKLFNETISDLSNYKNNLYEISQKLKTANKIYIFSSYIFYEQIKNLQEILITKKINVIFTETLMYSLSTYQNITKNDYAIFFIGGQDTKTIEFIYEQICLQNIEHVVFCTHSKSYKTKETKNKIIIDSKKLPHMPAIRKIIIDYLILQIVLKV